MDRQVDLSSDLNQPPQHLHGPRKKPRLNKKLVLTIGIAVAVIALGALALFLFKKDTKQNPNTQNQSSQQQTVEEEEQKMPPAEASQLQAYKSDTLNIEITHRKDWTVSEDAAKKLIVLTSPKFTFQTGNASRKDVFTLKIGFGATKEAQKNIDSAKAVRDSLLIGYDAPTEAQRHYTNVSYFGPPGEGASFFEFLLVTGSAAFKADAPVAGSIIINSSDFLIAGGFGADTQNQLTFEQVPAEELEQYSAYEQAVAIVKSLKVY